MKIMKTTCFRKEQEMLMKKSKVQKQEKYNKKFITAVKKCIIENESIDNFEKKDICTIIKLIKKGANINYTYDNGDNALSIVLKGNEPIRTDVLKALLFEKDIEIENNIDRHTQKTILERAAGIEDHAKAITICKKLVAKGAVIYDEEKGIDAIYFADEAWNDSLVNFFESKLQQQAEVMGDNSFFVEN
jgi:hypothetical protein